MFSLHGFTLTHALAAVLFFGGALALAVSATGSSAPERPLAHMVYFKLKDASGVNRAKLMAACKAYLSGHPGTVSFAVGSLAADMTREVNDRDFDVSLHLVFESKQAHDKYQEHPRHLKFIDENKDGWAKVRVFDSYLSTIGQEAATKPAAE